MSLRMFSVLLQEMINEIDQDGNGCISFNEFVYLMTKNVHEVRGHVHMMSTNFSDLLTPLSASLLTSLISGVAQYRNS